MTLPAAFYAQTLNWLKLKQPGSVSSLKAFCWDDFTKVIKDIIFNSFIMNE